jgi:hypothetical protein
VFLHTGAHRAVIDEHAPLQFRKKVCQMR